MPIEKGYTLYLLCKDEILKEKVRQEYLKEYLPLVNRIASNMAMGFPKSVELGDLVSSGVDGLIQALNNFEPSKGFKFTTYATQRIRGQILDDLRDEDWTPRSIRSTNRKIEKAIIQLTYEFDCKPPGYEEIAERIGISYDDLMRHIVGMNQAHVKSLDEIIYREDDNRQVPRIETVTDPDHVDIVSIIAKQQVIHFIVDQIHNNLSTQESLVIEMYYWEELTLKIIGACMKISESRVSQIHTKAVTRLREACMKQFGYLDRRDMLDRTLTSSRVALPGYNLPGYFSEGLAVDQFTALA